MKWLPPALALCVACSLVAPAPSSREARDVTITRDDWGIAHVRGHTDADAVFGMIYAQAEDDFGRIELNLLEAMGRRAEAEGEKSLLRDLRRRLFFDEAATRKLYANCEPWLRALLDAWADGLNAYLAAHRGTKPRVLARFEPWMALAFTEGSIGDDIESNVALDKLEAFYGARAAALEPQRLPGGSNGIAIAPGRTAQGHALLLINPHTTHYFRAELQMTSDEGLDAYGAVTWGQFFIYQGFNQRLGWMHTSSGVDTVDEYAEAVTKRGDGYVYRSADGEKPVQASALSLQYKTSNGLARKDYTVYRTEHGPVVRAEGDRWIALQLMQRPVEALTESFLRTKARDLAAFEKTMDLRGNSSNNTVYADADGHIAYFHPSFIARRDPRLDTTRPLDGTDPATAWQGLHSVADSPHVVDPKSGFVVNTNDWPWSAAGEASPRREDFPRYMDTYGENTRGLHAQKLLGGAAPSTLESLLAAAFDPWLPAFEVLLPQLLEAWHALPDDDVQRRALAQPIQLLRDWDRRWSATSVPTTLAVAWGEEVYRMTRNQQPSRGGVVWLEYVRQNVTPGDRLRALEAAMARLTGSFGTWKVPWGEVNRFQRVSDEVVQHFDDAQPSVPVPFTSAQWGSLAAFEAPQWALRGSYDAQPDPRAKRRYGISGNSFVAAVEFTPEGPRARAVTAGGESGDRASRHFGDQIDRYAAGNLREVYFTPAQLAAHAERTYRPTPSPAAR